MRKAYQTHGLISAIIISFSLVSFVCCLVAEFKKSEVKDVELDGSLCYLPGTPAFGLGIGGLSCLVAAQIMGSGLVCRLIFLRGKRPTVFNFILLGVSWICFGIVIAMISTATSMNRKQPYGRGWLGGDCYVVKDSVFVVSAILVILTIGCTMSLVAITLRDQIMKKQREEIVTSGVLKENQNGMC